LHEHDSQTLLKLVTRDDLQHTLVLNKTAETERYTLTHPTRADAYRPRMEHNGQGAWLMEGEQPQAWESTTLMRRLGHATDGFSNAELQQLRIISGTDEGVLRRVHLQNEAIPPLLDDTLARFRTHRSVEQNIGRIRAGKAMDTKGSWLEPRVTELKGWPRDKALEVFADSTLTGTPHHYGDFVPPADTFKISLADLNGGKLAPLIVDGLDEQQLNALVGAQIPKEQAALGGVQAFHLPVLGSGRAEQPRGRQWPGLPEFSLLLYGGLAYPWRDGIKHVLVVGFDRGCSGG
jgi:hypothetical protein